MHPPLTRAFTWLVVVGALLAPHLVTPAAPTTDGAVHSYNAQVRHALESGAQSAFSGSYELAESGTAATGLFQPLMVRLGPTLGWERAEKVLTLILVFLTLLSVVQAMGRTTPVAVVVAGWFASSWFIWMGFFDFSASIAVFALFVARLRGELDGPSIAATYALLVVLSLLHSFTLLIAVGAFGARLLSDLRRTSTPLARGTVLLPALALAYYATWVRGVGGSIIEWISPIRQMVGVVVGDFLVSTLVPDLLAGGLLTVGFLGAFAFVEWRQLGEDAIRALAAAGLLLIVLSLVAPDGIGEGSYIGSRLRMLGAMSMLPAVGVALDSVRGRAHTAVLVVSAGLLVAHSVVLTNQALDFREAELEVAAELDALNVPAGTYIDVFVREATPPRSRISSYLHLPERVSADRELIAVSNYQANMLIFPVNWIGEQPLAEYSVGSDTVVVGWPDAGTRPPELVVVHDCDRVVLGPGEAVRACSGALGVTRVDLSTLPD